MRPLFRAPARPIKLLWKMIPYFGVLLRVFRARNRAFSAPRIWIVDAGHLARFTNEPECEMRRAPTISPISADRLGATLCMRSWRYEYRSSRYWQSSITLDNLKEATLLICKEIHTGQVLHIQLLTHRSTTRIHNIFRNIFIQYDLH